MKKSTHMHFTLKENGVTLVELIIVILIISILAGISYAKYVDLRKCAYIAQCKANQQHLTTAQKLFWVQSSVDEDQEAHYADNIEDLTPYMKDGIIPQCPENGAYYILDENKIVCTLAEHAIQ
jgi:prepilin-type N-terminal cleavage/methylation domain-containing protein